MGDTSECVSSRKLLILVWWGNRVEGGNGADTNIMVVASGLEDALLLHRETEWLHGWYTNGSDPDHIVQLGQTSMPRGVVHGATWLSHAAYSASSPERMWSRELQFADGDGGEWLDDDGKRVIGIERGRVAQKPADT